jgi:ribosome-binding factor A
VAQLLHKELSALTVDGLRDPRIGLVTNPEVRLTDDLKNAQVFVSVLGDTKMQADTLKGLAKAAGYLKREITHRLGLRFAPNLHFSYDDSLARAQRLDELLHAAARGEHDVPAPAPEVDMPKVALDRMSPQAVLPAPEPSPGHARRKRGTKARKAQKPRAARKQKITRHP